VEEEEIQRYLMGYFNEHFVLLFNTQINVQVILDSSEQNHNFN